MTMCDECGQYTRFIVRVDDILRCPHCQHLHEKEMKVHVPNTEPPQSPLCWAQDPDTMAHCDRRMHGSATAHTWEMAARIRKLMKENEELRADGIDSPCSNMPVKYYENGTVAVYGSSSISYVEKLLKRIGYER